MSFRTNFLALALPVLALFTVGSSTANALPGDPPACVTVCGTPVLPAAEAVEISAPMGASYYVTFTNEFGLTSSVATGCVGPSGLATVMAPAIGITPNGARFLTVRVAFAGQLYSIRVESGDDLFLWQ